MPERTPNRPSVSVVIPTYNRSGLTIRAVTSALMALAPGDEIIVIDDGSTDGTASRLMAAFGDRIRLVRTTNKGAGAARNRGIAEARCSLIAFLDSDDEWFPDKLYLQRSVMTERADIVGCFSDFGMKDHDGSEHRCWMKQWCDYGRPWEDVLGLPVLFSSLAPLPTGRGDFGVFVGDLYPWLLEGNPIATSTLMIRASVAQSFVRFAENVPTFEDLWCFSSMARVGPVALLQSETAWNNGHRGPRLTNSSSLLTCVSLRLRLLEQFWGADEQFLARHRARFESAKSSLDLERAILLMYEGRMAEARASLQAVRHIAFSHRFIANMPAPIARNLLHARRWLRRHVPNLAKQVQSALHRHEGQS